MTASTAPPPAPGDGRPGQGPASAEGDSTGVLAGLRSRWALAAAATLLYWFAAHSLRPLVTLRLDELGASDAKTGLIVAAYSFVSLFVALPAGRVVDRLGVFRVLGAALVGMALIGIGYALATTPDHIFVLQVVNGVVELFVWLALQAMVSHAGSGSFLTRQLSLFSLAWGVGIAVGPILGAAVYARYGFAPLGGLYAGLSLLALVGLLVPDQGLRQHQAPSAEQRSSAATVRRITARPAVKGVLLSSFVALYVNSIKMSFYPLFLERAGLSVPRIGVLLSVIGVASLAVRVVLPAALRRWDPGSVLVWSMWASVLPIAVTPWLGAYWALAAAAALIGLGYGVNPPVTVQLMALHTEPAERGLAMGLRVTSNRLAQVAQPLVFGALISTVGMAAAFPASGVLLGALTLWAGSEASRMSLPAAEPP
ncbi:MAG: MFS transporter [Euzebyales bacterium]|nr:MFS transporter [Euzebyales bacterium]